MSSLSSSVLDAFEYHDCQHYEEANTNNNCKGKEVGINIKAPIVSDPEENEWRNFQSSFGFILEDDIGEQYHNLCPTVTCATKNKM